jgi:hypothetical protein
MQELELTMSRLLSVWWLLIWRGLVGGTVAGAVAGAVAGFFFGLFGHLELSGTAGYYAGLVTGAFWGLLVTQMAFKKKYKGFRLAVVSTAENVRSAAYQIPTYETR